jgi:hypothetical protein
LPLLLADPEARRQLIAPLSQLPSVRQLSTAPIFETMFVMHEAGETISFNTLHARVSEQMQDVLAALLLDAGSGTESTVEDGIACVEALRREDRESALRDLKNRIKSAEREGRFAEALALMQQLSQSA